MFCINIYIFLVKLPSDVLNSDLHHSRGEETMIHSQHQSQQLQGFFFPALYKQTRFHKVFVFLCFFWNDTFESSDRSVCVCCSLGGEGCVEHETQQDAPVSCQLSSITTAASRGSCLDKRGRGRTRPTRCLMHVSESGEAGMCTNKASHFGGAANRTVFSHPLPHTHADAQT